MTDWTIQTDADGLGLIRHHVAPRFTASWISGDADRAKIDTYCWSDQGSGDGEDSLHLFGFKWFDRAPDGETLERLMQSAAKAIDAWIARRL